METVPLIFYNIYKLKYTKLMNVEQFGKVARPKLPEDTPAKARDRKE